MSNIKKLNTIKVILFLICLSVYLFICFYFVLPECLKVWYPAGVNEFVFCFLLPPALSFIIYYLHKLNSIVITLTVSFICFILLLVWFGVNFFFRFFTTPHMIFRDCVQLLNVLANLTGTSYETINVLIFCLIGPVIFILMAYKIYSLNKRLNSYLS
jgi:hypothetical protein